MELFRSAPQGRVAYVATLLEWVRRAWGAWMGLVWPTCVVFAPFRAEARWVLVTLLAAQPLGVLLKQAAEDLKALYGEAATAQPNREDMVPSATESKRWFWRQTRGGALLRELADRLASAGDPGVALVARLMLVPFDER